MPLFTSRREKRLWLCTLGILAAIYSTLGIARPLSNVLRESGLLEVFFIVGTLLVIATILVPGLKSQRPDKVDIGIILGVVAVYVMVLVRIEIPEERTHLIEYSIVATFIYQALTERKSQGSKVLFPELLAILATAVAGTVDEFIQLLLPSRVFDIRDILFNILAGLMAVGSFWVLSWVKKWKKGKAHDRWTDK